MKSWKKALPPIIDEFRETIKEIRESEFKRKGLRPEDISNISKEVQKNITLLPPCQIQVIEKENSRGVILFTTFDEDYPDKQIIETRIPEDVSIKKYFEEHSKEFPQWFKKISKDDPRYSQIPPESPKTRLVAIEGQLSKDFERGGGLGWSWVDEYSSYYYFPNKNDLPTKLLEHALDAFRRDMNHRMEFLLKIDDAEKVVDNFKKKIKDIKQDEIRENLASSVEEIDKLISSYIDRLEKQEATVTTVKEDIDGVKQMVGVSKEFQDWRLLVTDVKKLKDEHISKGEFKAHMIRLDEKIEKGLDALNTRIEDLKAIKFWSKRTLLEIVLASWGAFMSLYVAGIIKF